MQEELNNEHKEEKKSNVGKILLVIVLVFIFVTFGGLFWGYRKVVSMTEPVNLGVEYTMQDYIDVVENIGIDVEAEKLCFDCAPLLFTQPQEAEIVVTGSQAAAAFDIVNERLTFGKVSKTQVRFSEDKGELSTIFTYDGRDYPVYISGNIEKASDRTISGEIFELKAGNFKLPSRAKSMVEGALVDLANERMGTMEDTFRIDDVKLTEKGLDFEGMVPTKAD